MIIFFIATLFVGVIVGFTLGCAVTYRNHNLYPSGKGLNRKEQRIEL